MLSSLENINRIEERVECVFICCLILLRIVFCFCTLLWIHSKNLDQQGTFRQLVEQRSGLKDLWILFAFNWRGKLRILYQREQNQNRPTASLKRRTFLQFCYNSWQYQQIHNLCNLYILCISSYMWSSYTCFNQNNKFFVTVLITFYILHIWTKTWTTDLYVYCKTTQCYTF
jgi:hypothetical protein